MNKFLEKTNINTQQLLKIFTLISFVIFMYYFSRMKVGNGDEQLFLNDLQLLKSKGWIQAISNKIGLSYLLLAYPFSFFLEDYIALRLVNVLLFVLLFIYFKKIGGIKNKMFDYYFLFFASSGWFMLGTNDTLFIVSLTVFFNEVYKFLENKENTNSSLMWASLLIAFFTRELIYIYLPVILFSFFLLYKKNIPFFNNIRIPFAILLFFIIINIPSLQTNHTFSYDNKVPPKDVNSNWSQRVYLAQLLVNSGKLENYEHPTWQQTDAYLLKNGPNSLPNSVLKGMTFDMKLTIKEFFKDFADVLFNSLRETGLTILIVIFFLFYSIKNKKIDVNLYLPFIILTMISIFSFIIISFVDSRWLNPVFIMSFVYYSDFEQQKKGHKYLFLVANLFFILIIFYGTFRVINKF